jgi:membrane protease YdiL (CAAX protease family)
MPDKLTLASILEFALFLAGLALLWRFFLSPSARERARRPQPLPHWDIPGYVFGLSVLRVVGITLLFHFMVASLLKKYASGLSTTEGTGMLIIGFSLQIGLVLGLATSWLLLKSNRFQARLNAASAPPPELPAPLKISRIPLAGLATFLVMMALIGPVSLLWQQLLDWLGQPPQKQEVVDLFIHAKPGLELSVIMLFAIVVAPVAEELAFRLGIFRYVRGRLPRIAAFALPALMFAAAHPTLAAVLPLFIFALIQSFAYERTGRIAVPMIAHGLFNLHTAAFILLEVDPYAEFHQWLFR